MPDPPGIQPLELSYSTCTAGQVSWQRAGDLLLITVREPDHRNALLDRWWVALASWAVVGVALLLGTRLTFGPGSTRHALPLFGGLLALYCVLVLWGAFASPRKLLIRVNDRKLLIDEVRDRRPFAADSGDVALSVTGRAWTRDEVASVVANRRSLVGGSLDVKTATRRLAPLSVIGYDPGDMAWAADVIRKVLDGGVDAWIASQSIAVNPPPGQQPPPRRHGGP